MAYISLEEQLGIKLPSGSLAPSNDLCYGPYDSFADAITAIGEIFKRGNVPLALTCGINENGRVIEYRVKEAKTAATLTANDFELKVPLGYEILSATEPTLPTYGNEDLSGLTARVAALESALGGKDSLITFVNE